MSYNGWSNYPTWCVNLWLTNEEGTSHDLDEIMRSHDETYARADALKAYVEELAELIAPAVYGASFVSDLFGFALGEADFFEIVEAHEDDLDDEDDEDDDEEEAS